MHLLFAVNLSLRGKFLLGQLRASQKRPSGSTLFYKGLLINIYNIITFWIQHPTSIYFRLT